MRFMIGIVIAGIIVVAANVFFVIVALDVDQNDQVDASYESEAR